MPINQNPSSLIAGADNLILDKRKFNPSRHEIKEICRFFNIGELQYYEKEKNIVVSHANFFVFVKTSHGPFALKFHPKDATKTLVSEYAINRILIDHHFLTPLMCRGKSGQPFFKSNDRLSTCYPYIDGSFVWRSIKNRGTFSQINAAMLSLKNILSASPKRLAFLKQKRLPSALSTLIHESRIMPSYDQKDTIEASLLDACRKFQDHQILFSRQWLHSNASLTNFLILNKKVYTLDLSHVQEDYCLSDLASLVISCLFFDISTATIMAIIKDHFNQHGFKPKHFIVLDALIKIGLVREYLKNIRREESLKATPSPSQLARSYLSQLKARKGSIAAILKKRGPLPS